MGFCIVEAVFDTLVDKIKDAGLVTVAAVLVEDGHQPGRDSGSSIGILVLGCGDDVMKKVFVASGIADDGFKGSNCRISLDL